MIDDERQMFLFLLALYLRGDAMGQAPDREELFARNPDLADDLELFLNEERFQLQCGCCSSQAEMTVRLDHWTRAVNALSEEQCQMATLGRLHGLSVDQIGERLGLAPDVVRRRLAQASSRLRDFADHDSD